MRIERCSSHRTYNLSIKGRVDFNPVNPSLSDLGVYYETVGKRVKRYDWLLAVGVILWVSGLVNADIQ